MKCCAVNIRCMGVEHALRMMVILLDITDLKRQDFDELLQERKAYKYTEVKSYPRQLAGDSLIRQS